MTALATAADTANAPVPFAFESHQIRTIVNGDGIPWFVAKDVTTALGLVWNSRTLGSIPDEWKRLVKMSTLGLCEEKTSHPKRGGLRGGITAISEPAVYKLAFRSNKPEADRFTNWVASEVIPALRRQGKYELCPTRDASRLTTAKERNALTGLVNRYVGLLPGGPNQEAYKAAWRKVHDVMGITAIEDLTVEQLPRAVMFVQSLVDAAVLPEPEVPKALPAAHRLNSFQDYARFYKGLPASMKYWTDLSMRNFRAFDVFEEEIERIRKDAGKPFSQNKTSDVSTFLDEAMMHDTLFRCAIENIRMAYRCMYDALEGLKATHVLLLHG